MRFRGRVGALWAVFLAVLGTAWRLVGIGGDVDFLINVVRPLGRWLVGHGDELLWAAAVVLAVLNLLPRPLRALSSYGAALRYWWRFRRYTSVGLTWDVVDRTNGPNGTCNTVIAIWPVPGSELPQPLYLLIKGTADIRGATTAYFANDGAQERPRYWIEIGAHRRCPYVEVRLETPKLLPPARFVVTLGSDGNTHVEVEYVKRRPG